MPVTHSERDRARHGRDETRTLKVVQVRGPSLPFPHARRPLRIRRNGLHVLALTDERGRLVWISAARPGRTHDSTAARRDRALAHLRAAALGSLADLGFLGLDDDGDDPVVVTGFKATRARRLASAEKEANRVLAAGRVPVERGFAP
ncbi:transposase family protein [Streptomyces sp. NPDC052109]|uniref:transposase family protein n=1 Tax=Streptomyces sp. NPDC052109 TaxID=3155527 RepID=UPI0034319781